MLTILSVFYTVVAFGFVPSVFGETIPTAEIFCNDIGRNCLLGHRKKIAKFLMRTFTCCSTFLYAPGPLLDIRGLILFKTLKTISTRKLGKCPRKLYNIEERIIMILICSCRNLCREMPTFWFGWRVRDLVLGQSSSLNACMNIEKLKGSAHESKLF